ncbi:MAG TPA: alpha/beta hydrolase [Steroidobacteraceae bacterium]|nr:alpha/beta hydrolase [Steroidobacteraceae bacterium]
MSNPRIERRCGVLVRPLDPTGAVAGTIPVYFEYYPHTGAGPSAGTLVATEGGPGFPATDSRDEYLALYQPLRATHDVLIMDNRGTGRSGSIDCEPLQSAPTLTLEDIGACGRTLGSKAPLYSTTLATDDLAALLDELRLGRIDLYGDSYGTYFAQVFALRHGERLRSLVLDGAYPLEGAAYPWYPHYAPAMRAKFNLACERDPACEAIAGSSMDHIAPALARLRAKPFAAEARLGGATVKVRADATALAIVMFGSSPALASVRELDAAARAFDEDDRLPLLRLMAETVTSVDSRDPTHSPVKFSSGLAAAVSCQDPPQIVDMNIPVERRQALWERQISEQARLVSSAYAPFTMDEYRGMPPDYAFIDECMRWPAPAPGARALPLVSGRGPYPDIPVLVVSGELDNMTSVADGAAAAGHYSHARHVIIANSFHVNALPHARSECGADIVRHFIEHLEVGDVSCADRVPPVRLVPRFARRVRELAPAKPLAGNEAGTEELRVVTAVLLTAEDVADRAEESGVGLRGGSFSARQARDAYEVRLEGVRWTEDLSVSGRMRVSGRNTVVWTDLIVGSMGRLRLTWSDTHAATVEGELGGKRVVAAP